MINDLELKLSDEEIGEWQMYADTNQNGSVCWAEFEPLAAELIAKFYSDHPPPEGSEEEWKEGTDEAGRQYRVNLSTGAQEWLEAEGRKEGMGPHLKHMHLLFEKHDTDKVKRPWLHDTLTGWPWQRTKTLPPQTPSCFSPLSLTL